MLGVGESVVFVGPTRSGKSNLISWLLSDSKSVVIIDSKRHPDEWARWGPSKGYRVTSDPKDISKYALVVYQVPMTALVDRSANGEWTQALTAVMARGNTVVVFDETVHVLPAGHPHPLAMQIYTQGAAWGLTPWAGSQYANRIETMTIRSAIHCFAFRLNPYDLKLLGEKRGIDASVLQQLPDYGFGHHLTNTQDWSLCSPVEFVMR